MNTPAQDRDALRARFEAQIAVAERHDAQAAHHRRLAQDILAAIHESVETECASNAATGFDFSK